MNIVEDSPASALGFIVAADEKVLRLIACSTFRDEPTGYLVDLYGATAARPIGGDETEDAFGYHRGGLWELLPSLEDVPTGMTFSEDARLI